VSSDNPDRDYVQSLSRGLTVLEAFNAERPAMTLADMARATGLTRATARRLLHTLVALGFVSTDGRTFELTPRVLDLGFAYVSSLQLPDIAQPFMEALSDRVHESVSASVLDGSQIVYVARVNTQRIMGISLAIGSRLPAAWTSMGRVLLAGLTDTQLDGFLDGLVITPLTTESITDIDALRSQPGLRTDRPRARRGNPLRSRAPA
jgi:IclR family transcriptional regulator, pca regulon regulatory protein